MSGARLGRTIVVTAGAGSGKTYDLCDHIAESVLSEKVAPERILATTFTRKAAAELGARVQERILRETSLDPAARIEMAERLELAAIGTVHSVGHLLLRRYALHVGLSPRLRVLNEDTYRHDNPRETILHELLGQLPHAPWRDLADLAMRLGQPAPQQTALELLDAKRSNLISDEDFLDQMAKNAARTRELLAPSGADPDLAAPWDRLRSLVTDAIRGVADAIAGGDDQKNTAGAHDELRRIERNDREEWRDFGQAAGMKAGKTSGANDHLDELRGYASRAREIPELHDDVTRFVDRLARQTVELGRRFQAYKHERGVVDFTDLEVDLLRLLENEELADMLREDFDLVLVDEFQDTNPLQLAIFLRLAELAGRSRWVGDEKQAIYGFRGSDAALMRDVWDLGEIAQRERLEFSWRSRAGLVAIANALFTPVFGEDTPLVAKREGGPRSAERWILDGKKGAEEKEAIAKGIAALHEAEGVPLADIAVLCRTNAFATELAATLDRAGIPALYELSGLLETREGAMALAGLKLVADRNDGIAAATILHLAGDPTAETPEWLEARLRERAARAAGDEEAARVPFAGDPVLAGLEAIDARTLPPSVTAERVIRALDLGVRLRSWSDPPRRSARIDAFLSLARRYEVEAPDQGRPVTVTGLIAWFEALAAEGQDVALPPTGLEAVSVMTYHQAKGLEWPIVVLTQLDWMRPADLFEPYVTGGDAAGGKPLEGREVRFWVWPFGASFNPFGGRGNALNLASDAAATPEGRDRLAAEEEELDRLLYVGFTRARDRVVLAHRPKKLPWLGRLKALDGLLDASLPPGEHPVPGCDTTFLLRRLEGGLDAAPPAATEQAWLKDLAPAEPPAAAAPERWRSPSGEHAEAKGTADEGAATAITFHDLPGDPAFPNSLSPKDRDRFGDAVHAYFAALPGLGALDGAGRAAVARRCIAGFEEKPTVDAETIVAAGERFLAWCRARYPEAEWRTEVPVTGARAAGGFWAGSVDWLLVLPNGRAVLVDHKTTTVPREMLEERARGFAGQLGAYREALGAAGVDVAETWLHFPLAGVLAELG